MLVSDPLSQEVGIYVSSSEHKCAILKALFGCQLSVDDFARSPKIWGGYFEYYHEQSIMALSNNGLSNVVQTHGDVVSMVKLLQVPEHTRETIQKLEKARLEDLKRDVDHEKICNAIDLGVKLGMMLLGGEGVLAWQDDQLLVSLSTEFSKVGLLEKEKVRLDKLFNARNLDHIAGLKIVWTSNLADHLRVQNDDTEVSIFHCASFLKCQTGNQVFPSGFIDETIRTLGLLLPQYDKDSNKWFGKQGKNEPLDENAIKCGHLTAEARQIENFHYWRDRLIILKQVFDEAKPRGIKQWWRDRRDPVQWYSFWFAVAVIAGLTILFGLVQCVEGGIQVWKAYHPS
ncbi:hypothetical protein BJ875DRAFT_384492 [Amylocarpus encephaloides]|uniref:Uncharacterized protein n=1 Tax=Amylocarpus encephaloides TaxID=45428 RepID=A0A9P8C383_9HELO|nr:hypothetical protein BJ875DRAFT_384492 [Amylocarpus encephaloides]